MTENLKKIGKNYKWLTKQLENFKIKPEEALVVTYDRTTKNILPSKGKEKMKEIIIICLILLIIISGDILQKMYIENSSKKLSETLQNINTRIDEKADNKELSEKYNKVYEEWQRVENKWSVIVLHNELDLIEIALIEGKTNIEKEKIEEGKVETEKAIFLINHIIDNEKISLKNIF